MRLTPLILAVLFILPLTGGRALGQAQPPSERPNILFVLIDDMGYHDLSCFGDAGAKTPEIDRLASEGLRFTQFYVNSPICSPSRVALTTGQYPNRWAITSFLSNHEDNQRRGMRDWLSVEAPSLARPLAAAGYHTAHVGKWHMGGQRDVGNAPLITEYGFATSLTNFEGLGPRVLAKFGKRPDGTEIKHGPTERSADLGGPIEWAPRHEVSEKFVDRAIREMDAAAAKGQPFYINLWPDDVHSPWHPPPELLGDGSPEARYKGVLRELDRQLGRVFAHVRARPELRDNTLILLASDNGHAGGRSSGDLRGNKGTLYEGGIRSPLIVWGPGLMAPNAKPGASNDRTVLAGMDFPPSLIAIAAARVPDGVTFDGRDMSDVLLGRSTEARDRPVMWLRPPPMKPEKPDRRPPELAIRDGDWKLLVRRDGSGAELYDVVRDPAEKNDVSAAKPEITRRLTDAVLAWDKSIRPGKAGVKPQARQ